MAQEKEKASSPKGSKFGHWMRVAVMFMTGGFVFPHAMTEDDDAKSDADRLAKKNVSIAGETPKTKDPLLNSAVR